MSDRLRELAERRKRLIVQASAQRGELEEALRPLRAPIAVADQSLAVLAYLRSHPGILLAAGAALLLWRPTGVFRWLGRGFTVWRLLRS